MTSNGNWTEWSTIQGVANGLCETARLAFFSASPRLLL